MRSVVLRRPKVVALFAAIPVLIIGALFGSVSAASAWHAEISAKADCKGTITFTASSWTTGIKGANSKIGVYYSLDNKTFTAITPDSGAKIVSKSGVNYEFTAANNYRFTDSFVLPNYSKSTSVTIKTVSLGPWGDGTVEKSSRTTVVTVPAPCATTTTTSTTVKPTTTTTSTTVKPTTTTTSTTVKPTTTTTVVVAPASTTECAVSGIAWTVTLDNTKSKLEQKFTVVDDQGNKIAELTVKAGDKTAKSYPFKDVKGTKLQVKVGDKIVANTEAKVICANASANVVSDCKTTAGTGAVFTFTNKGTVTETFTVTRDGKAVEGSPFTLKAGEAAASKFLKMNEDETAKFLITSTSGVKVEKTVTLDCVQVSPTTVVKATTTTSTTAPAQVLGETVTRPALATTGSNVKPMLFAGAALVLLGAAVLIGRRKLSAKN